MALHASLVELAELAARCESPAAARGIVAESHDLVANAVNHGEDACTVAAWYSRLITDIVRSPALDSPARLTGAVARGDATPAQPIEWLGEDDNLAQVFKDVEIPAGPVEPTIAARVDAGLPLGHDAEQELLQHAMTLRPPALVLVNGLPSRDAEVNIEAHLLAPVSALARWAAPAPRPTPDRLAIGRERELLTSAEVEAFTLAWQTAMTLQLRSWVDHVPVDGLPISSLGPLDRTAYGAACRMVAEGIDSVRNRLEL